jgi:peptide/nickel transport system permease protein
MVKRLSKIYGVSMLRMVCSNRTNSLSVEQGLLQRCAHSNQPEMRTRRAVWWSPFLGNRLAVIGVAVLLLLILMTLAAPLFATHDPFVQNMAASLQPPSKAHWLGVDKLGRDTWSRLVYGARPTLAGAFFVVLISALIGVPLGLLSGYEGGRVDNLIMRGLDMVLAFPALLLAILVVATFGRGLPNTVIALGIVYVPASARVVRSVTLVQRQQTYVEAARAVGCDRGRILFRHLLPNLTSPLLVQSSIDLAFAILDIAALSFLGLGIQPPDPDWGSMLAEGRAHLLLSPYVSISAGLAIMIAVIAFNLVGDGLRALFDPQQSEHSAQ